MIYFAKSAARDQIKIGTTTCLRTRFGALEGTEKTELDLLAVMDGNRPEEKELHLRFSHLRVSGEWFRPADELLEFIAANGKEWAEEMDAARRTMASLKGTSAYAEWLEGLIEHVNLSPTVVIELALREYAINHGYEAPQPRR
jgi:hypothetical protein